jgi:hypothetical protein
MLDEIPSGIYALDKLKISLSPLSLYATQNCSIYSSSIPGVFLLII